MSSAGITASAQTTNDNDDGVGLALIQTPRLLYVINSRLKGQYGVIIGHAGAGRGYLFFKGKPLVLVVVRLDGGAGGVFESSNKLSERLVLLLAFLLYK